MQRFLKGLLVLTLVSSTGVSFACSETDCTKSCDCNDCCNVCSTGHTYFSIRSQSINAARDLVGWQGHINKFEMNNAYGAFYILPEYTRSFKPCRIAGYFFGEDYKNGSLTISGSRKGVTVDSPASTGADARTKTEWLADYFGLSPNHVSQVSFSPRISNFQVDLGFYLGLDEAWEGGFFRVHAPIVNTRWALNPSEKVSTEGTLGFDAGYMGADAINVTALKTKWLDAMSGTNIWGDMKEALKYGKIDANCCKKTKTRLSDIEMAFGWNFVQDEDYHFGLMIRGSIPTGNKPTASYLFEPIVGSGGHWMLGAGLTSHANLWTSDEEDNTVSIYIDANVGHYFRAKQMRSFDLKDKPNSRYVLIQELGTPVAGLYAGADNGTGVAPTNLPAPSAQYEGNLFPLINKATCCSEVSIAVQGDLAIKLAWAKNNWCIDLGYNLWGRTGEKFKDECCGSCCLNDDKRWALKGDAFVIGFKRDANVDNQTPVKLSATQSAADIHGGMNTPVETAYKYANDDATSHVRNPSVDNAQLAWFVQNNADAEINYAPGDNDITQTKTSKDPVFISCDDLNNCETPSALSHKLFAHINYNWNNEDTGECEWNPFLGLGGEVEFAGKRDGNYSAVSQWGIWLKGGLVFN